MPGTYISPAETKLYYLQSKYYNPELGRFINADNQTSDTCGDVLGCNIFAYCMNNTANFGVNDVSFSKQLTAVYKSTSSNYYIPEIIVRDTFVRFDVPLYNQNGYNLCWAFCQVMVEDYQSGVSRSNVQATVRAIEISMSVYGNDWNQGGWPTNVSNPFAEFGKAPPSVASLYSALVNNGPIYAYYGGDDGAHLVVVTGVNLSSGLIYTNNPWGIAGEQSYANFLRGFVGMPSYWDMPFGFLIYPD